MNDLVTVIIATYGRSTALKRAIYSVLNQTYSNLEILIIDDNDDVKLKNNVREIVDSIPDKRIKLISNKKNLGGSLARNVGIMNSSAKYISFLDDDDEYLPEKIEKQINLFLNSNDDNLALIYGFCLQKRNGKPFKEYKKNIIGHCIFDGMIECVAATSQWMCKKELLLKVGMFEDTPCKQDSYLILKLLCHGYTIDRVPEILSVFNTDSGVHRISTSSHKKRIVGEEKLREYCRANYNLIDDKQKKEVEYSFFVRLLHHYYAINDKENFRKSLYFVIRYPFRKSTLSAFKDLLKVMIYEN